MPSCLIIEQDGYWTEQIRSALASEGWPVRMVQDPRDITADTAAADLVFVGTDLAEATHLLRRFSRRNSPGCSVGLAPPEPAPVDPSVEHEADGLLRKPFTEAQLWRTVRSLLSSRVIAGPSSGDKLTSKEIFGDMLAELTNDPELADDPEMDAAFAAMPATEPTSDIPETPPPPEVDPPAPVEPRRRARSAGDDLQRKLEETLSGVLSPELLHPDLVKARERPSEARLRQDTKNIDKLLSDTLSGLNLGGRQQKSIKPQEVSKPTPPAPGDLESLDKPAKASAGKAAMEDPFKDLEASVRGHGFREGKPAKQEAPARSEGPARAPKDQPVEKAKLEEERILEGLLVDEASNPPEDFPPGDAPAEPSPATSEGLAEVSLEEPAGEPLEEAEILDLKETAEGPDIDLPVPILEVDGQAVEPTTPEIQLAEIEDELSLIEESLAIPQLAETAQDRTATRDSTTAVGQQFGHYTLLERIAVGGMAEVWKARMDGVAGFQKTVAIKKILPHLTENDQFQRMFVDEARLAAELNHPNITHIYDLGVLQGDYYIAMEFVEGRNLRSILNLASRKGMAIPHDLALLIASRLASALDYAHRKRDSEDRELGLVHRDVSPQNVLVSYEGDIKLCDFGIVKAVTKLSKTESGALKGKLQYMSPEQAWGRDVDSRSDIFSIGALLFEMLTGLRLFSGETELSVLEAVRSGRTRRPRDFDPTIPDAVDELVARAVAQEPADRFQQAGRMRDQIESIFEQLTLRPSNAELASYLRRLISAPDLEEDSDTGPSGRIEKVARFALPDPPEQGSAPAATERPKEPEREAEIPFVEAVSPVTELPPDEPKSRRGLLIAVVILILALGIAAFALFGRDRGGGEALSGDATTSDAGGNTVQPAEISPEVTGDSPGQEPADAASQGLPPAALESESQPEAAEDALDLLAKERERIQQEVAAQVAAQEEELRKTYEAKERQLKSKLAGLAEAESQQPAAQKDTGEVVPPGPGVKPPVLVSIEKPQYSAEARLEAEKKEIVLYLLVNQDGQVEQVRQAQGSDLDPGVNEAAIRAARAAVFKPATKDGRRVKMWTTLKIPLPTRPK